MDFIPIKWTIEPGFFNAWPCFRYLTGKVLQANNALSATQKRMELQVVDACVPALYQNQNKKILLTNNWIGPELLDPRYYQSFSTDWYGIYAGAVDIVQHQPVMDFNCFINRMDPIRQSWLYQFVRRDLFDQGYISFNMNVDKHVSMKIFPDNVDPFVVFDWQFEQHLKIFRAEHDFIRPVLPYRNFETDNLDQIIMSSKFSLILENSFDQKSLITLSEKIFRCMKLPRPWLLFANANSVKYLKDAGFDVLDDIVDHSYDSIEFEIDRQVKILDIMQDLCKLQFNNQLHARLEKAAMHNQKLLDTMFSNWHHDVDDAIVLAQNKCRNLANLI
jgi:hypothetical protein